MALTRAQLCELVLRSVNDRRAEPLSPDWIDDIESKIGRACQRLADRVAREPERSHLLKKAYTLTFVAGEADLSAFTDMVYESLPKAHLSAVGTDYPFVYLKDHHDLYLPTANDLDLVHYAIHQKTIAVRDVSGTGTYEGTVTADEVGFIPIIADDASLTTLPAQLEDDLVETLANMVYAPMPATMKKRR